MEENKFGTTIFIILIVAGIWLWSDHNRIKELESQANEYQNQLDDYEYALDEANSNIETANSYIEDAQSYAWSTYDDMGYALDNLEIVETVNP